MSFRDTHPGSTGTPEDDPRLHGQPEVTPSGGALSPDALNLAGNAAYTGAAETTEDTQTTRGVAPTNLAPDAAPLDADPRRNAKVIDPGLLGSALPHVINPARGTPATPPVVTAPQTEGATRRKVNRRRALVLLGTLVAVTVGARVGARALFSGEPTTPVGNPPAEKPVDKPNVIPTVRKTYPAKPTKIDPDTGELYAGEPHGNLVVGRIDPGLHTTEVITATGETIYIADLGRPNPHEQDENKPEHPQQFVKRLWERIDLLTLIGRGHPQYETLMAGLTQDPQIRAYVEERIDQFGRMFPGATPGTVAMLPYDTANQPMVLKYSLLSGTPTLSNATDAESSLHARGLTVRYTPNADWTGMGTERILVESFLLKGFLVSWDPNKQGITNIRYNYYTEEGEKIA